jgi:hypothetical protein
MRARWRRGSLMAAPPARLDIFQVVELVELVEVELDEALSVGVMRAEVASSVATRAAVASMVEASMVAAAAVVACPLVRLAAGKEAVVMVAEA